MRALVVYESLAGPGQEVGAVLAGALRARGICCELVEARSTARIFAADFGLLVVAVSSPTRALPRQPAWPDVARRLAGPENGVRDWLDTVIVGKGQPAAAFGVAVDRVRTPSTDARAVARRLRDKGAEIVGTATFHVNGTDSVLADGEENRVRAWAAGLVVEAAVHRVG